MGKYYNGGFVYENKKYTFIMGCRGGGRIYYWSKRIGYEKLLCEGIRWKIKYPLRHDMDEILERIMLTHSYYSRKSQLVFENVKIEG